MRAAHLLKALTKAGKRSYLLGNLQAGVIVALDLEGRWFAVLDEEVLNRVNPEAVEGLSTRERYLNPGGDGLWPAPEGTTCGYEYSTGAWRVPPGITSARYRVAHAAEGRVTVEAEVDLVNNHGLGVPTIFRRQIAFASTRNGVHVRAVESIRYVGRWEAGVLAPWTLCQFDCGPGCEVVFPCAEKTSVWDLYQEPSDALRTWNGSLCHTRTDGTLRYQLGCDASVPWLEFHDPGRGLVVRRKAGPLPEGQSYIDIRDAAPEVAPSKKLVRYSIYSDKTNFMEIEAAGGCPAVVSPNTEMSVAVSTKFTLKER